MMQKAETAASKFKGSRQTLTTKQLLAQARLIASHPNNVVVPCCIQRLPPPGRHSDTQKMRELVHPERETRERRVK